MKDLAEKRREVIEIIRKKVVLAHDLKTNFGDVIRTMDIPTEVASFILVIEDLNWLDFTVEVEVKKDGYLVKKSKTDTLFFKEEGDVIEWVDSVIEDW